MQDATGILLAKALFDKDFYATTYPEVQRENSALLDEYLSVGWREGRDPSPNFSTRYYLNAYPDVRKLGVCPLVHYATQGAAQGRLPRPRPNVLGERPPSLPEVVGRARGEVSPVREIISNAVSPRVRARAWRREVSRDELAPQKLHNSLLELHKILRRCILSFSHDDYVVVDGGVQNCISDEEHDLRLAGWIYVHLRPALPLPLLSDVISGSDFFVSVRVNGELIGVLSIADLLSELAQVRGSFEVFHFVVHHMLGFSPEILTEAAGTLAPDEVFLWLHDFFTLCTNHALLRNDVEFCHAPEPNSQVCDICCYGTERKRHVERMKIAFETLRPTVLAPSETALSFWKNHQALVFKEAVVVPHGELIMEPTLVAEASRPLRIGYLGVPAHHKGWHIFEELAHQHAGDDRYSFHQLGVAQGKTDSNIAFVEVSLKEQGRTAMIDAVTATGLDVVINWSLCYETFSFTAHEAVAGGALVVTREGAGNIMPAIGKPGIERGYAVRTEKELLGLFSEGGIRELAKQRRFANFRINSATATYLLGNAANV